MKLRIYLSLIVLFTCISFLNAQKIINTPGNIPDLDAIITYPEEPDAPAVVLKEEFITRFYLNNGTFYYETTHFIRLKVLTEEGVKYAQTTIPFYTGGLAKDNSGNISQIKGSTYNWNGKKFKSTPLAKSNIQITDKEAILQFAEVNPGSIIEYQYKFVSNLINKVAPWDIQREIPVLESRYRIIIPDFFNIEIMQYGNDNIISEGGGFSEYYGAIGAGKVLSKKSDDVIMTAYNIGSFHPEKDLIWYPEDYRTKVKFNLDFVDFKNQTPLYYATNWEEVDATLFAHPNFGEQLNKDIKIDGIDYNAEKDLAQIANIYDIIRERIEWDSTYLIYSDIENFTGSRIGFTNNAGINMLLINQLKKAGYEVYPVLLKTKNLGVLDIKFETEKSFNHLIAAVSLGDSLSFLDATSSYSGINILPLHDLVKNARLMKPGKKSVWIDLSGLSGGIEQNTLLEFETAEKLSGKSTFRFTGENVFVMRKAFKDNSREKGLIESFDIPQGIHIKEMTTSGWDQTDASYIELTINFDYTPEKINGNISFNPLLTTFFNNNPVSQERNMPVDINFPMYTEQSTTINLNEKITLKTKISPIIMSSDINESPKAEYAFKAGKDSIELSLLTIFPRAFYPGNEIKKVSQFFGSLQDINLQKIEFTEK